MKEIIDQALEIKKKYSEFEQQNFGRSWTSEENYIAFVKDVGELGEIIMAQEGIRKGENIKERLAHELADCLFSIIVLADNYDIDLEKEFKNTMQQLNTKLQELK